VSNKIYFNFVLIIKKTCNTLGKKTKVIWNQYIFKILWLKKKLKQSQTLKIDLDYFSKLFKIDHNTNPKNAHYIICRWQILIAFNNRNNHADAFNKNMMHVRISKNKICNLRMRLLILQITIFACTTIQNSILWLYDISPIQHGYECLISFESACRM
jgi:hypothetical protein